MVTMGNLLGLGHQWRMPSRGCSSGVLLFFVFPADRWGEFSFPFCFSIFISLFLFFIFPQKRPLESKLSTSYRSCDPIFVQLHLSQHPPHISLGEDGGS